MKKHKQTVHEGRRDYKCDICGDAFSIQAHVKRHIQTVHEGRKDYKCEYCGTTRTTSTSLRKHILRDHQGRTLPIKGKVGAPFYSPEDHRE